MAEFFRSTKRKNAEQPKQNVRPVRSSPQITWVHRWPADQTKTALTQSPFGNLPTEVILEIFKHLSVHDLGQVSLVCRSLKMMADQDDIWKLKCNTSTKIQSKSFKEIYMDWMHEKYLRNIECDEVERIYRDTRMHVRCGMRCRPPQYPMRPAGKHHFAPIGDFKQHPNDSQNMTIQLSVDVDKTAVELISLLEKASKFQPEWRQSSIIKQMITRYFRFMQLKASSPNNLLLIPTLDIEIIWQTHVLRPKVYHDDCMRLFHRVIDHSLLTNDLEQFLKEQAFIDTCKLYKERYGEEYCPLPQAKEAKPRFAHPMFGSLKCLIPVYSYWDETHYDFSAKSTECFDDNPFSFAEADVILDGNWLELCKRFMSEMRSKVGVTHYGAGEIDLGKCARERLKKSYERFLYMSALYPPMNGYSYVHPTAAIDIIWHSHMQEPLKYAMDCQRLVGYLIDHAPWPSVDEKQMKKSFNDTQNVWKTEFESEMITDHLYNTNIGGYDTWDD